MAIFAWTMMAIAIWHFAIFIPDRFWGGIVGAFLAAVIWANLVAWAISGFSVPGNDDTHLLTALEAIPGTLIGMGLVYAEGVRRKNPPVHL